MLKNRNYKQSNCQVILQLQKISFLFFILTVCIFGCTAKTNQLSLLPEIKDFLTEHREYGNPVAVEAVPNWAEGKRQRVTLEISGKRNSLLFYIKDDRVVTIYEDGVNGRKKIWSDYEPVESSIPKDRNETEVLPSYTVLSSTKKMSGGKFGDILIPSFSRKIPVKKRETIFRAISSKEGIEDVSFYSTNDAYKANISASFLKSHPDALRKGLLGLLQGGKFTAGETLYPE